jgi:hypothetical protein
VSSRKKEEISGKPELERRIADLEETVKKLDARLWFFEDQENERRDRT